MPKERNVWWLILGASGISGLAWLTNTYGPAGPFMIQAFFALVFVTVFCFGLFFLNHTRRALLAAMGITGLLLLRLLLLREIYYTVLLAASLVSLEVYLNKR